MVRWCGQLQWFEQMELDVDWLRRPQRKIAVFPHGIYTITRCWIRTRQLLG